LVGEFDQFLLNIFGFALGHIIVNAVFHAEEIIRFLR